MIGVHHVRVVVERSCQEVAKRLGNVLCRTMLGNRATGTPEGLDAVKGLRVERHPWRHRPSVSAAGIIDVPSELLQADSPVGSAAEVDELVVVRAARLRVVIHVRCLGVVPYNNIRVRALVVVRFFLHVQRQQLIDLRIRGSPGSSSASTFCRGGMERGSTVKWQLRPSAGIIPHGERATELVTPTLSLSVRTPALVTRRGQ